MKAKSAIVEGCPVSRRRLILSCWRRRPRCRRAPLRRFRRGSGDDAEGRLLSPRTGAARRVRRDRRLRAEELVRKALASGLRLATRPTGSTFSIATPSLDPSRAGQLAKTLINSDKIDMMLVVSTPETINPVADACEAAGVPCLSTVMPWESWYFGRGASPASRRRSSGPTISALAARNSTSATSRSGTCFRPIRRVGALYPNDADGNAIRDHLAPALAKSRIHDYRSGPL